MYDLEKVSKAKDKVENNESTKAYVGEATHHKSENNTIKGFCAKQPVEFKDLKSSHHNWTECAQIQKSALSPVALLVQGGEIGDMAYKVQDINWTARY